MGSERPAPGARPQFAIRRGDPADVALLHEFGPRVFRQTFAGDPDHTPEDMRLFLAQCYAPAAIAEELADPDIVYWLALGDLPSAGSPLAGYLKIRINKGLPACVTGPRPLEIGQLYVDFAWHGGGVAHALMERALAFAAQHDFQTLWLGVWHRNLRAQRFYQKWGFHRVGQYPFQFGNMAQKDEVFVRAVEKPVFSP